MDGDDDDEEWWGRDGVRGGAEERTNGEADALVCAGDGGDAGLRRHCWGCLAVLEMA